MQRFGLPSAGIPPGTFLLSSDTQFTANILGTAVWVFDTSISLSLSTLARVGYCACDVRRLGFGRFADAHTTSCLYLYLDIFCV